MLVLPVVVLVGLGLGREGLTPPHLLDAVVAVEIAHDHITMRDSAPAGTIELVVTNHDSVPHGLAVRAVGATVPIAALRASVRPGGSAKEQVTLAPGAYEVYCPDAARRLKHRLVVLGKRLPYDRDR